MLFSPRCETHVTPLAKRGWPGCIAAWELVQDWAALQQTAAAGLGQSGPTTDAVPKGPLSPRALPAMAGWGSLLLPRSFAPGPFWEGSRWGRAEGRWRAVGVGWGGGWQGGSSSQGSCLPPSFPCCLTSSTGHCCKTGWAELGMRSLLGSMPALQQVRIQGMQGAPLLWGGGGTPAAPKQHRMWRWPVSLAKQSGAALDGALEEKQLLETPEPPPPPRSLGNRPQLLLLP